MPEKKAGQAQAKAKQKRPIERYEHSDKKRVNNPQVGLVDERTDPVTTTHKTYDYVTPVPSVKPKQRLDYDPHLDPQLVWAGKKEHTSFEVPTVSLHVHERIDPHTIIQAVRKKNGDSAVPTQASLFERPEEKRPLREEIDFYKHSHGWSNRLIAGDSLLVMNSLLEKEGMAGQVQMVYIDPPYGIKYGSNFQPFVNKRDVKDGKDDDLTQEPEMIRAFRDTWELGIHSYLSYLRDRLLLARDLLNESGSCFVQISADNLHHVRELVDEIFGAQNLFSQVIFQKSSGRVSDKVDAVYDVLLWYSKNSGRLKFKKLFKQRTSEQTDTAYSYVELHDGKFRMMTRGELLGNETLPANARRFRPSQVYSQTGGDSSSFTYNFKGREFDAPKSGGWRTSKEGLDNLARANRLMERGQYLAYKMFSTDFPFIQLHNIWSDVLFTSFGTEKVYVVQTSPSVIRRCLLMTTDPGDLVFDPTCGSGTTAVVAEEWGRRWITCDTSRVATTLAKQRLTTTEFDYYELGHPDEGVGSGFRYKTVPHVTLKSIANNPEIRDGMIREQIDAAIAKYADQETLYDQPYIDKSRVRVTGPFTVEAVPAPTVRSLDEVSSQLSVVSRQESQKQKQGQSQKQPQGPWDPLESTCRHASLSIL